MTRLMKAALAAAGQAGGGLDHPRAARRWTWRGQALFTSTRDFRPGDINGEGNWQLDGVEGLSWEVANLQ